jgi:hypothetical protein
VADSQIIKQPKAMSCQERTIVGSRRRAAGIAIAISPWIALSPEEQK